MPQTCFSSWVPHLWEWHPIYLVSKRETSLNSHLPSPALSSVSPSPPESSCIVPPPLLLGNGTSLLTGLSASISPLPFPHTRAHHCDLPKHSCNPETQLFHGASRGCSIHTHSMDKLGPAWFPSSGVKYRKGVLEIPLVLQIHLMPFKYALRALWVLSLLLDSGHPVWPRFGLALEEP